MNYETTNTGNPDVRTNLAELKWVFIIVPTYNEAKVIQSVVENLYRHFYNVVVVNDGSTDSTVELLKNMDVMLVNHPINLGQGAALQTGITYALSKGARWIITFDADGQHKVEDALRILKKLLTGNYDVVLGSRFLGRTINMPWSRWLLLKGAVWVSNLTTTIKLTDIHNGLRALNYKAASALDITQNRMAHASEIIKQLAKAKMKICEVPVTIEYTEYTLNKGQSTSNAIDILVDLIVARLLK